MDLTQWMRRFTNDIIIFRVRNDSVASYYKTLLFKEDLSEKEKAKIEESEHFIQSIETFTSGIIYFMAFNKFIRHYVPFIRGKVKSLLRDRDYLYGRIHDIIKERRAEIENTPLDHLFVTTC